MSDLIHLCPFTIRCEQPSKQIEALSVCPDSLSSFFRYIFAIPAPRGGGEQLSTAMETQNSNGYEPSSRSRTGSLRTILSDVFLVGSIPQSPTQRCKSWTNEIAGFLRGQTVAIDGKTLRGSHDAL